MLWLLIFIPTMIIGTVHLYHFMQLFMVLTLAEGNKGIRNQNLLVFDLFYSTILKKISIEFDVFGAVKSGCFYSIWNEKFGIMEVTSVFAGGTVGCIVTFCHQLVSKHVCLHSNILSSAYVKMCMNCCLSNLIVWQSLLRSHLKPVWMTLTFIQGQWGARMQRPSYYFVLLSTDNV